MVANSEGTSFASTLVNLTFEEEEEALSLLFIWARVSLSAFSCSGIIFVSCHPVRTKINNGRRWDKDPEFILRELAVPYAT